MSIARYKVKGLDAQVIGDILLRLLPVCGIVGITLPLVIGQPNLTTLGLYLGIPMILAPIIYTRYQNVSFKLVQLENRKFYPFIIIYLLSFTASLILLYTHDVRPYLYYLAITIIVTIILLEILHFNHSSKKSTIILLQIMAVVLNLTWGVTLNYHYFIARTDPLAHAWLITNLLDSGYVTDIFGIYEAFPLWHILVSSLYQVLNLSIPPHKLMFFTNGLIYSFAIPVIYLISSKIFKNEKIPLLSALFLCIYPDFIFYGMSSIARSVVTFLMFVLILLLLGRTNKSKILLILIVAFALIAYHTASMPFILAILLSIYIMQYILAAKSEDQVVTPYIFALIGVMTLVYWIYQSVDIFQTLASNIKIEAPEGTLTQSIVVTPLNEVFNYLQFTPLLLFVILGCTWALAYRKIGTPGKIFCFSGLLLAGVAFPGPALLINKLARNLNIGRFGEYAMLFIAVAGAVGLYMMYVKSKKYQKYLIVILFATMCFLSVSNDFTASDNPLVKRPFYTYYLTEEETTAFDNIANATSGYVMADYVTCRYMGNSAYSTKSHILEVEADDYRLLRDKAEDTILIRDGELAKRPVKLYSSPTEFILEPPWGNQVEYYYADSPVWSTVDSYNKVFHTGTTFAIT